MVVGRVGRGIAVHAAGLGPFVLLVGLSVFCNAAAASPKTSAVDEPTRVPAERAEDLVRAEFLAIAQNLEKRGARFIGGPRVGELRRRLGSAVPRSPQAIELRVHLGVELLRLGDSATALTELQKALRIADGQSILRPPLRQKLLLKLAVAGLRLGEQANCVERHSPLSCILPIAGPGVHTDPAGAQTAMDYARQYLSRDPGDLRAIWFLNLAAMQAGSHPAGVPEPFLIAPERFTPAIAFEPFRNIAHELGIATFDLAGGSIADDFDGDGLTDLLTSSMDPLASLTLLHNDGDGSFADWTRAAGLGSQLGGLNLIHADYDDDGLLDLFVLRGGWLKELGTIRNSLLRHNRDHTFTDVTRAAGLAEPAYPTQTGAWADYDGDGDLDLYIGNEGKDGERGMVFFPNNLFRNEGDGTFADMAPQAGVTNERYAKGVAWGDYDSDGDPDLYVSNIGPNRLYRNEGDGTFADMAPQLGVTEPGGRSFATWFFDYDNDGDLDLFVVSYLAKVEDIAADLMGRRSKPEHWPRLYRNDGGRFVDVTAAAGLDRPSLPMGANFGDIDEDGFLDIYLGTGAPAFEALMPNIMYRNNADGTFTDITFSGGFGHLQKGHGISFADFDCDGDADLALQAGGFYPGDRFANALFENPGHGRRFVSVKAVGRRSNRAAVGTRIHVRTAGPKGERSFYRWVGMGSSFGGSPLEQSIGLGLASTILYLELDWPSSGVRQRFTEVPLDAFVRAVEGEAVLEIVERPRLHFSSAGRPGGGRTP